MSINRLSLWGPALLLLMVSASNVQAQHYTPFGDWDFGHDFQPFAPAVLDEYGFEPIPPNTGWFFSMERCYLNVGRQDAATQPFNGDFTWGNRWDLGFMTEEDHGWLLSAWNLRGPVVGAPDANSAPINFGAFSGVELNKMWRLGPCDGGSFVEPFIGVRNITFKDRTFGMVENNIIGGQLGLRWYKQTGHYKITNNPSSGYGYS